MAAAAAAGAGRAAGARAGARGGARGTATKSRTKARSKRGRLDGELAGANRSEIAQLAGEDRARDRAYKRGQRDARARTKSKGAFRRHRPDVGEETGEQQSLYDEGFRTGIREARRERVAAPAERGGELVDDGSGVLLGVIAWALVLAYINHDGWAGVRGWIAAKFINRPLPKDGVAQPPSSSPNSGFGPDAGVGGGGGGGGGGSW